MFNQAAAAKTPASAGFYNGVVGQSIVLDGVADYLNRTMTTGDTQKVLLSFWVKRSKLGTIQDLFWAGASTRAFFDTSDRLEVYIVTSGAAELNRITTRKFRDVGQYYNIVISIDLNNATGMTIIVNGVVLTDFDTSTETTATSDTLTHLNVNSTALTIGSSTTPSEYFNGYMAQVVYADGQTSSNGTEFGEFKLGVWIPIDITTEIGAGANSFFLNFDDSADLGNDDWGNVADLTLNSIAAANQTGDNPEDNYCTLSSIDAGSGALTIGNTVMAAGNRQGTFPLRTLDGGKFAWKVTLSANGDNGIEHEDGTEIVSTDTSGEVLEYEFDLDNLTLKYRVDGGGLTTIDATVAEGLYKILGKSGGTYDFDFTPTDSDYKMVRSSNLPTVGYFETDEEEATAHFITKLYEGTAAELAIATGHNTDVALIKNRDAADEWELVDSIRGATKEINPDALAQESTVAQGLKSFDDPGVTLGTDANGYNASGESHVLYSWVLGTTFSGTSNKSQSYSGEVNTKLGMSCITYTGSGSDDHQIPHNLGVAPEMVIVGKLDVSGANWYVGHNGMTSWEYYMHLDGTFAENNATNDWYDTAPTSTVVTLGNTDGVNTSAGGASYIMYCFASTDLCHVFSYVGNGNADGSFIWMPFRPAMVWMKDKTGTNNWSIFDTSRDTYNPGTKTLQPDGTVVEQTTAIFDIVSNGVKIRDTDADVGGTDGNVYIGVAFAGTPFKFNNGR